MCSETNIIRLVGPDWCNSTDQPPTTKTTGGWKQFDKVPNSSWDSCPVFVAVWPVLCGWSFPPSLEQSRKWVSVMAIACVFEWTVFGSISACTFCLFTHLAVPPTNTINLNTVHYPLKENPLKKAKVMLGLLLFVADAHIRVKIDEPLVTGECIGSHTKWCILVEIPHSTHKEKEIWKYPGSSYPFGFCDFCQLSAFLPVKP